MWLLPVRTDHVRSGAASVQSSTQRRRHRYGALRKYLPVRHVCAYSKGCPQGSGVRAPGEIKMSALRPDLPQALNFGRRIFLQQTAAAAGGLVLAFALPGGGGSRASEQARGGQMNAWLRIGADDSITMIVDRS